MKLTVKKEQLQKALQKVTNIIGSKSTLPVLGNVLFEAIGNKLILTTTDLEIRITTTIEAQVQREGKTTIPAKKISMLVSKFIDDEVFLDCNEKHHTDIVCGTANFKMLGLPDDDFPSPVDFAPIKSIKFKEMDFLRILDQISYAVSLDDSRKVLHGILCSIKDNTFTAVATDGKRLALVERVPEEFAGQEGDTIVPLKSAIELKRILEKDGNVTLEFGDKQARFRTEGVEIFTKLIEGNYPNYRQVIPAGFTKSIDIPVKTFIAKLELVSIALTDSSAFIKLKLANNKMEFLAASSNVGEGEDHIDIDYDDEMLDISFNPAFLADPFKHCDADKMMLKLNDSFSPVALESGDGFLYVIMPMRNR
ncbi:MAG: DNA polymerase III subunit beta [Victivallales bacterium]|nr:DNA polymerase III subunit beta [Victivallales bacterium]